MFPESTNTGSKVFPILIAFLVFSLIVGGIGWFYFNSKSLTVEPVATTPTTNQPTSDTEVAEPTVTTAPTELVSAISQLDQELSVIGQDEQSDDDTINF